MTINDDRTAALARGLKAAWDAETSFGFYERHWLAVLHRPEAQAALAAYTPRPLPTRAELARVLGAAGTSPTWRADAVLAYLTRTTEDGEG